MDHSAEVSRAFSDAKSSYFAMLKPSDSGYDLVPEDFLRHFHKLWLYQNNDLKHVIEGMHCGSFSFVFHKNIQVTDLCNPELVALIRLNSYVYEADGLHQFKNRNTWPEIVSTEEFRRYLVDTIFGGTSISTFQTIEQLDRYLTNRFSTFVSIYINFLSHTIVVNSYYTTAIVHVPRTMRLDLASIIAASGYIHSIGHALYVRRAELATEGQLLGSIDTFLSQYASEKPIYFTPYCDEFFDEKKYSSQYSMKNGLDGIKLSARKHYIGSTPALELLETIALQFSKSVRESSGQIGSLALPHSDDFVHERQQHDPSDGALLYDSRFTIFIISDRGIRYSKTERRYRPSDDLYVICYSQMLKNDNQLLLLKEQKPGWDSPITLPHTFSSALCNIIRSELIVEKPVVVDPFAGTGTTILDYSFRTPEATCIGFDRNPLFSTILTDNIKYFAGGVQGHLEEQLTTAINYFSSKEPAIFFELRNRVKAFKSDSLRECGALDPTERCTLLLAFLVSAILRISGNKEISSIGPASYQTVVDAQFDKQFAADLNKIVSVEHRILVYVMWRALFYNSFRFHTSSNSLPSVLADGLKEIRAILAEALRMTSRRVVRPLCDGAFNLCEGVFSHCTAISSAFFTRLGADQNLIVDTSEWDKIKIVEEKQKPGIVGVQIDTGESSIEKLSQKGINYIDVIITDPPYGVNTDEGGRTDRLERLYADAVDTFVKILRPGGILCLVLPASSKNGRKIPAYATEPVVRHQLANACRRYGKQLVNVQRTVPNSPQFPQSPYYWNAARGVSRKIILCMVK